MELLRSFTEGDVVEVTSEEEGFLGSWYIAAVVRPSRGKKKKSYLVEYHTLTDEQGNPLRETIDASNLRPRSPSDITPFYQLNEEIDAFYNDGWWKGVIVEVLEKERLRVFFASTRDEIDFGKSELRSHLEWVDGVWARCQDRCDNGFQLSVELTPNHVPAVEDHEIIGSSETEVPREKGQPLVQHPLPMKQLTGSIEVKQQRVGMVEKQTVHHVNGKRGQLKKEELGRIKRQKLNVVKGKCWRPRKEDSKTEAALEGKDKEKSVQGNPTALDSSIVFSKEGLEHEEAPTGDEMMDIIVTPECAELPSHTAGEHELVHALLEQSNSPSTTENRGLSPDNSLIPDEVNAKSHAMETLQLQNPLTIVECPYNMEEQTIPDECDNDVGDELNESTYGEEGTEQLSHVVEGHTTLSGSLENSNTPIVVENRGVSPDNELMLNEATVQEAATECLQQNACNRMPSTQEDDTAIQSYLVDDRENISTTPRQGDDAAPTQSLPFIKSSPLWTTVDSMDAMQLIPQHPHFHPLEQYNEDIREGLAIGWMINFANLVTRTLEIQFDGTQRVLEQKLMSLAELEKYGFTIQPLRNRLEEMREIKDKSRKLNDDLMAVAKQFMEQRDRMNKLDAEIDEHKEAIAQLDKKLQSIIMEKDTNGATLAELRRKADAIEESIQGSRHEFDSLRAAPW